MPAASNIEAAPYDTDPGQNHPRTSAQSGLNISSSSTRLVRASSEQAHPHGLIALMKACVCYLVVIWQNYTTDKSPFREHQSQGIAML